MANTVVGLEITEEGVRAVEVTTGKNPRVVGFGSVPLPAGATKDSEIFDRDAVVLALRQLWSRGGISGRNIVLGLGSRRILVREYTTQALRPDLLKLALPFQVQDLLPVPADQAVLDFYPLTQEGEQVTGLLVAAVSETVEELIAATAKAKLTVDVVGFAPFGLAQAVARISAPGETIAAIHIGDHTSYVVVMRDGVARFVRIIAMDVHTDAVMLRERLNRMGSEVEAMDAEAFDEILQSVPADPSAAPMRRSRAAGRNGAVRATTGMSADAINDLVARIRSTLTFYSERSGDQPLNRVVVSGAGAAVPGIVPALAASMPLPVTVIGLSSVIAGKRMPEGAEDLDLLTTVGIALGEVA